MRKVLVFGNGLGMALDPSAFELQGAMNLAWSDTALEVADKELIAACLPSGTIQPSSEEQLGTLQEVVGACEVLLGVHRMGGDHWLTEVGQGFPEAVYRFSFLVARHMYLAKHSGENNGERCTLPREFVERLAQFIADTSSHVATLNYDGLLSRALSGKGLLDCDDPLLLNGFVSSKFERSNLFRKNGKGAWYLHLHGSPLFADRDKSRPYKLSESSLRSTSRIVRNAGKHVVLTHFRHKPKLIEASAILSTYWEFLERAIDEAEGITLFGYSGNDQHLNRLISQTRSEKDVTVVEWLGTGTKAIRKAFWAEQLGGGVELRLLEDVLTFSDW